MPPSLTAGADSISAHGRDAGKVKPSWWPCEERPAMTERGSQSVPRFRLVGLSDRAEAAGDLQAARRAGSRPARRADEDRGPARAVAEHIYGQLVLEVPCYRAIRYRRAISSAATMCCISSGLRTGKASA